VLVIEDEPLIRLDLASVIEDAGYGVVAAASADEAIAILSVRSDIRLIVTDIEMPGSIDGLRLAWVVRNRWPPIHIVVTSGRREPALSELPERSLFMAKPFESARLVGKIGELMA
jgi:CheY-like chemotaxis protein